MTTVTVTGTLYTPAGLPCTTGVLRLRPRDMIPTTGGYVAPFTITYPLPSSGVLALPLAPSSSVLYDVEYDPDPDDLETPLPLKRHYFTDIWQVSPTPSGTVDVVHV